MFVEEREDEIVFADGWKAYISHEMSAGAQEDLEELIANIGQDGATPTRVRRFGEVKLVSLCLRRVVAPDGTESRPAYEQIRRMRRMHFAKLVEEIAARNLPLGAVGAKA